MTQQETRLPRLNKLIEKMEATIAEARETSARMTRFLGEAGIEDEDSLRNMLRGDQCSPALRALVEEDLANFQKELKEGESALLVEAGHRHSIKPHRRRHRMLRI